MFKIYFKNVQISFLSCHIFAEKKQSKISVEKLEKSTSINHNRKWFVYRSLFRLFLLK